MNTIRDLLSYAAKPFIREGESDYFGGKRGLDIADPLDIGYSSMASLYRLLDKGLVRPTLGKGVEVGDMISKLLGEPISSEEELHNYMGEAPFGAYYHPFDEEGGDNIFIDKSFWKGPRTGVHVKELYEGSGVEPFLASHEIGHGKRFERGVRLTPEYDATESQEYIENLIEEFATSADALGEVTKKEGIGEAALSIPSFLSSWLSYVIPSSEKYNIGEVGIKPEYELYDSVGTELLPRGRAMVESAGGPDKFNELISRAKELADKKFPTERIWPAGPLKGEKFYSSDHDDFINDYILESLGDLPESIDTSKGHRNIREAKTWKDIYDYWTGDSDLMEAIDTVKESMAMEEAGPMQTIMNWWAR